MGFILVMVNFILKNTSNQKLGSIFDLGCGTGLLGQKIKKYCSSIEGIDLSKDMLEEAKKKQIYCKLYHVMKLKLHNNKQ